MRTLQRNVLIFSAIFHIFAVFYTEGFHRPDEYLGIFQWMQLKLGDISSEYLSWEFKAQIRTWIKPYFFSIIVTFCRFLKINNPFYQATILRFICSFFGFIAVYQISQSIIKSRKSDQFKKIALIAIGSLWFLPFIHARTTGENLGASFFVFGCHFFLKRKNFLAGLMMGLCFAFRFQMIFMIAPYILWQFIFNNFKVRPFAKLLAGMVTSTLISTTIDYFGYGNWTFTPFNYYYQNIVLGVASSFGVDPWWKYFDYIFFKGIPPFSLIFLLVSLYSWIKRPFSIYSFVSIPFFIVHSLIAHKELRFLFPLWIFMPFLIAEFFERFPRVLKFIWKPYLILSMPLMFYSSFTPAHSPIEFYKYIYYEKEPITKIHTLNLIRDQLFFYQKNPIELVYVSEPEKLKHIFTDLKKVEWFLTDTPSERELFLSNANCVIKYQSYSDLILKLGKILDLEKRWKTWTLFRCD
jgi:phosphatidylinositol glycan class B